MNVGHEDEELKPYIEPVPDYKDPKRTGTHRNTLKNDRLVSCFPQAQVHMSTDVRFLHSHTRIVYLKENCGPA